MNGGAVADSIVLPYIFRANSIWDPEFAVGGFPATYWSIYSQLYSGYRVHGCKITCRFVPVNANTGPSTVGIRSYDDRGGTTPTTFNGSGLAVSRNIVFRQLQPMAAGSNAGCRLTMFRKSKNVFGVKDLADEPTMGGQLASTISGTNPDRQWYYQPFVSNMNAGQPATYNVQTFLAYYVELFDPKEAVIY